ncbi:MAG: hypothetical protein K6G26_07755, partial [Lachnospiraceae bacterium]|nr:hypothetical protein [Lachnospiraceae bacterium]
HINIELFYRKKEMGYLQVFNIPKKRVKYIIFSHYMRKNVIALVIAEMVYHIAAGVTYIINGMKFILPLWINLCIAGGIILYSAIVISIPVEKYMRKNIISLIKE